MLVIRQSLESATVGGNRLEFMAKFMDRTAKVPEKALGPGWTSSTLGLSNRMV